MWQRRPEGGGKERDQHAQQPDRIHHGVHMLVENIGKPRQLIRKEGHQNSG